MVRFKNRYLLVEFLVPSSFSSTIQPGPNSVEYPNDLNSGNGQATEMEVDNAEDDDEEEDDEDEDELLPIPKLPFLLPVNANGATLKTGDDGANLIYKSVRNVVTDVFGDEGWGRIASSFRVLYHSPLTTLTFVRIARSHYRLLWSAFTLLTTLGSVGVIPRVICVSGTIRKLQNRGIAYHRAMVGAMISAAADQASQADGTVGVVGMKREISDGLGSKNTEKEATRERDVISRLADV